MEMSSNLVKHEVLIKQYLRLGGGGGGGGGGVSCRASLPLRKSPEKGFRGLHVAIVTIANTKQRIKSFPAIVFVYTEKKEAK